MKAILKSLWKSLIKTCNKNHKMLHISYFLTVYDTADFFVKFFEALWQISITNCIIKEQNSIAKSFSFVLCIDVKVQKLILLTSCNISPSNINCYHASCGMFSLCAIHKLVL